MVPSPVHPSSLVDPALHSPALLELLDIHLSRPFIEYLVDQVVDTVDYALGRPSSSTRGRSLSRHGEHARFTAFVSDLIHKAEVQLPVLLATLVYIDRAKPHLQIALEQWACERVFLGALVLANKYCNDSTLKNVHWALCTGVFGKRDVGRIEREFLDVLDFELGLAEADLLSHHACIMAAVHGRPAHPPSARTRARSPRHAPRSRAQSISRWSDDSSDLDMDDASSSTDTLSAPRTPEGVDHAFLPALPKLAHAHAPAPLARPRTPARPHAPDAPVYSHAGTPYEPPPHPPQAQARRASAAMQLLHAFPLPFHPRAQAGCRPIAHTYAVPHTSRVLA